MYVIKRNGRKEAVMFDKITARMNKLSYGLDNKYVQPIDIAKKVIQGMFDGVTTSSMVWTMAVPIASVATPSVPIPTSTSSRWRA